MSRSGEGLSGRETTSKRVPHGEPYAGELHVRFDEGYPQSRRRVAKRCTSRGAGIPHGASRSALHPLTFAATPELVIPYYDPRTKTYKSAKTGGTPLYYNTSRGEGF